MPISEPSPEKRLLVLIARRDLDEASVDSIKNILETATLDWEHLSATASAHGLIPLLATHLPHVGRGRVPEFALSHLEAENQRNTEYSLWLTGELMKLATALRAAEIPFITFKGPALALMAYGDIGLRQFTDLDLLIDRKDIGKVKAVLSAHGFGPVRRLTDASEAALLRFDNALAFTNEQEALIDVHWRFTAPYLSLQLDTAEMRQRVEYIDLGESSLPTLSAEDSILVSCVHGFTHQWERLIWACDVATLMRRHDLDWNYLIDSARRQGMLRILLAGVAIASELGAALPQQLNPEEEALVQQFKAENSILKQNQGGSGWLTHQLRMRERLPDRIKTLARLAFTPRDYDCAFVSVSPSLNFLYYLIRPVRMVSAYGSRFSGRRSA